MKLICVVRFIAIPMLLVSSLLLNAAALDSDGDGISDYVAIKVSAGKNHTCALDATGVHCWGANDFNQLEVPALSNPVDVVAGQNFSCALDDSGVQCWGDAQDQKLVVPSLLNPVKISAVGSHACALDLNGVHCWGSNDYGQIDVPETLTSPFAIAAGGLNSCAIDSGSVSCWGNNQYLQSTVPNDLTNPTSVSAGGRHVCVIDDGVVKCWGNNTYGQITVPEALVVPEALTSGGYHSCVIGEGVVQCWGANTNGQRIAPGLSYPVSVSAGFAHTCASDSTGVHCWGSNASQQTEVPNLIQAVHDNCSAISNPDQLDSDNDGFGDACDQLPSDPSDTVDTDNDGIGNITDPDDDGDGIPDVSDVFPLNPAESVDTDGDGVGNNADLDDDNDGEPDVTDPLPLKAKRVAVFRSVASKDGWILESSETSKRGGMKNISAYTVIAGDNLKNKQFRSVLHFDTAGLPNNAIITKATLWLRKQSKTGSVTSLGDLVVDLRQKNFGNSSGVELADFHVLPTKYSVAKFKAGSSFYSAVLGKTGRSAISKNSSTQFRLRFSKDDNNDKGNDYLKFYSGNASKSSRPALVVEYYLP